MRLATWLALVVLTAVSLFDGRLGLALVLAGVKALLLGFEFMELRFAARAHAAAYALFVTLLVVVLEVLAR